MIILGINAFHGDASAAILVDGQLVAAVEEERFTRIKHDASLPTNAARYCLETAGARLSDVTHFAIPRDARARWRRKLWYALRMPGFLVSRVRAHTRTGGIVEALGAAFEEDPARVRGRIHRVEHHRAHLASAFFTSPFDRAAVLSLDGFGDFSSARWGIGEGVQMRLAGGVGFPHSMGLFYSAVTQLLGFPHYGDEYKVMGLASFGHPVLLATVRDILRSPGGLGYSMDLSCFLHHRHGPRTTWEQGTPVVSDLFTPELERRLGARRRPGEPVSPHHQNVAASVQARFDELVLAHLTHAARSANSGNIAYAGGVALNCVANGRALAHGTVPGARPVAFQRLHIPPAPGDGGLSLGAALDVYHGVLGKPRAGALQHAAWGPRSDEAAIAAALETAGLTFRRLDEAALVALVAERLDGGGVIGWYQGRSEFGPRALGQRSILADPRRHDMPAKLNARIKRREAFRPFAPSVMSEHASEWFDTPSASRFMLLAVRVRDDRRAQVPAITHVDGTARPQLVERAVLPLFWSLLGAFRERTGVPMVLNTSFNDNEPIVQSPSDAIRCFTGTELDALAIGPFWVAKHLR